MGMRLPSEASVVADVLRYLTKVLGWEAWRVNGGAARVPAELVDGRYRKARTVRFSSRNGLPDIIAIAPPSGRHVAIECKHPKGGRLRPSQKEHLEAAERSGALVIVARDVLDVVRALEREGLV